MRDKEFQKILGKFPEDFRANRQERIERGFVSEDFHQISLLDCTDRHRGLSRLLCIAPYGIEADMSSSARNGGRRMDRTSEAVQRQVSAMGAPVFEIGLFKPSARDQGQAVMIPRTWDIDTLTKSIPWLRLQNADGRNIYIRPKGEHDLSLVDDLTEASVQRMKTTGFAPALVVETSPGNFQAWLKHSRPLSREVSTAAARALAERFEGDPGAADWRHFGRLAGFTNRKDQHRGSHGLFPFVRVIESTGALYPASNRFLQIVEAQLRSRFQAEEANRLRSIQSRPTRELSPIARFRDNGRYEGDGTRIDLAYSIYALSHGATEAQVAAAIRSRDLSHKGTEKRQAEYVERTVRKARLIVGRQVGAWDR
jgi:hypothetical protein